MLSATTCKDCDEVTYHIAVDSKNATVNGDGQVVCHLDEDDMLDLYFQLKDYKCGFSYPEVVDAN